jgi:rhodanese-related sulfurtransferase
MKVATINVEDFAAVCREGRKLDLIDVRTPAEFRAVHLQGARNIPLDELNVNALMTARSGPAGEVLYVVCQSGSRGRQACERFLRAGYGNVVNIEGGISACVAAGLRSVRGKPSVSLERQVRIVAGLLVMLGAALSFVHQAFIGLSAFVGAGLLFAGLSDTCGMALLLARMPWNQCRTAGIGCAAHQACSQPDQKGVAS